MIWDTVEFTTLDAWNGPWAQSEINTVELKLTPYKIGEEEDPIQVGAVEIKITYTETNAPFFGTNS